MSTSTTVARNLPTQKKQRIADLLSQIIETLTSPKPNTPILKAPTTAWVIIFPQGMTRC